MPAQMLDDTALVSASDSRIAMPASSDGSSAAAWGAADRPADGRSEHANAADVLKMKSLG